ncbi:hypothetical protein [Methanomicrobium mobile]|uniref:hypothetical protein n=1 Tax=Methanomicrobium mobile TaxID=2205 RepID=UPI0005B282AC|nr:hypothetical protein [Methanomicrobium mobile]
MARELSERDLQILRTLAPENEQELCPSANVKFKSILPPLCNHIAESTEDFDRRLSNLSREDWEYLTQLIVSGEESICCLSEEAKDIVIRHIAEFSEDDAAMVGRIFELEACGMI